MIPEPQPEKKRVRKMPENCLSQREVADRLGLTQERVGQIEREALRKLRLIAESQGLSLMDLLVP